MYFCKKILNMISIEIEKTLEHLKKGNIILYPTDTIWGIGCDATNAEAVSKIYELKKRQESKSMLCLVSELRMLEKHVFEVPDAAYDIIEHADKPTTVIYDKPIGVAKNLIAEDDSLGIRLVKKGFAFELLKKLRRPLVSTSANISGFPSPKNFSEITPDILNGVDYVVNLPDENTTAKPSSIIKLKNDGQVQVIRK